MIFRLSARAGPAVTGGAMSDIVDALEAIVGARRVSTSEAVCQCYQFNCFLGKDWVRRPDMVVLAETAEEVSGIVKAANRYRVRKS